MTWRQLKILIWSNISRALLILHLVEPAYDFHCVSFMDYLILINFAAVFQIVIFTTFLFYWHKHDSVPRTLLLVILLLFLLSKGDDLLQQTQLILAIPSLAFIGNTMNMLLGPVIWFYILSRTHATSQWRWRYCWHGVWGLLPVIYLYLHWWGLSDQIKLQSLQSGAFANTTTLIWLPLYGDSVLVMYLLLAVRQLRQHGVSIRQWFSSAIQSELQGLRALLSMFALMVLLHMGWVVTRGWLLDPLLAWWTMAAVVTFHLVLLNGVFIEFLLHKPISNDYQVIKEEGSTTSVEQAQQQQQLIVGLNQYLDENPLYLDPDLTIAQLARPMQVHFRTLSVAINTIEGSNFFEFINRRRVTFAADKLLQEPQQNILDIAYASGFNSKSAFNTAFRKYQQMTPSQWRQHA